VILGFLMSLNVDIEAVLQKFIVGFSQNHPILVNGVNIDILT